MSPSTATTTATQLAMQRPSSRLRRHTMLACERTRQTFPHSIEALDLPSSATLFPRLASVRLLVLDYLADLEARIADLEPAARIKSTGEVSLEEAQAWAQVGLEMLQRTRADVCSYLPDLDAMSVEHIQAHLPDLRAHLPDIDLALSRMRSRLQDVRTCMPDMPDVRAHRPLSYIPQLAHHLETLHAHFAADRPSAALLDMMATLSRELVERGKTTINETEDAIERAAREIRDAMNLSFNGSKLIQYADLPLQWRNNEFVRGGYRFIPLERWPLILLSLFALHNETVNIHTHLIPFLIWLPSLLSSVPDPGAMDTPELAFTAFALLCLLCSAVWHTMAGCAHAAGMELCARVDYVGIGWLIAASVGTVIYYGCSEHPNVCALFLGLSLATGVAGSVLPFQAWFNERGHKRSRIAFFLTLAFTAAAPLAYLAWAYSPGAMVQFIAPLFPSILSYLCGLLFYATHIPECFFPAHEHDNNDNNNNTSRFARLARWLDWVGGGSHAIWHVFIVLAIWQHRRAMGVLKEGIERVAHT